MLKALLITTAIAEIATGLALLAAPALPTRILLGVALDLPAGLTFARVAGVGMVSLGVVCWLARREGPSGTVRGLITGLLLYNFGVVGVLVYSGLGMGLSSIGLWPAVVFHTSLTAWCLACLRAGRSLGATHPSPPNPEF